MPQAAILSCIIVYITYVYITLMNTLKDFRYQEHCVIYTHLFLIYFISINIVTTGIVLTEATQVRNCTSHILFKIS